MVWDCKKGCDSGMLPHTFPSALCLLPSDSFSEVPQNGSDFSWAGEENGATASLGVKEQDEAPRLLRLYPGIAPEVVPKPLLL